MYSCVSFALARNPVKGIDYLVKNGFLELSPQMIAKFLLTRRGLSRTAIGDYLGTINEFCTETTKHFMRSIDMNDLEVDEALRAVMSNFRNPVSAPLATQLLNQYLSGESQKIEHLMTVFQEAYVEQNESRVQALFKNPEKIFLLSYAIMILQTDLHVAKTKPGTKMKRQDFIKNLRPVNPEEEALNPEMLGAIYDRIAKKEITTQEDHTDFVRKIEQSLTGSLKPYPLAIPQRRLVCYCRLYEVPDKTKKERLGSHERDVFLFNDMLLITKSTPNRQKRNTGTLTNANKSDGIHSAGVSYQVKASINLLGIKVALWENGNYSYGVEICKGQSYAAAAAPGTDTKCKGFASDVLFALNTKTSADRKSFFADLVECIQEVNEQDRIRIEGELAKGAQTQQSPTKTASKPVEQKAVISPQQNLQFVRHLSTGMIPTFPANGNGSVRMNAGASVLPCNHCNGTNYVTAGADGQAILLHQQISPHGHNAPILLAGGPGNITVPAKMLYTTQGPVCGKPPIMYLVNNNNGTPILHKPS
ncbi:IQ motif and S7 domain-containing protein 1 [Cichlidogyrus casuarinus]|uniref:IQ motif and S7 domain-containing protein 1 n=1 Tax=Cichlidogyrus casuarinus TaxID=1844966 RepID=A0ABD2Q7A3_9PLAT